MAIKSRSPLLRGVKKGVKPTRDDVPLPDGVMTLPLEDDRADHKFAVSPMRALLADRARTIRSIDHVPTHKTRKGVMYAAGLGMTQEAIAKIMGISKDTLRSHYEEELAISMAVMMNDIQTNMYNIARDPTHKATVTASIFLLSRLGGDIYKEVKKTELTGKNGEPLQIDQQTRTIDPSLLNSEQRDALRDILTSAMKLAQPQQQIEAKAIDGQYEEVK